MSIKNCFVLRMNLTAYNILFYSF